MANLWFSTWESWASWVGSVLYGVGLGHPYNTLVLQAVNMHDPTRCPEHVQVSLVGGWQCRGEGIAIMFLVAEHQVISQIGIVSSVL